MKRQKLVSMGLVLVIGAGTLTGCSGNEIKQLKSLPSLNSESTDKVQYKMTMGEKQSMIYAQVSERQLLDLSLLDNCNDEEIQQVKQYMNQVDSQLTGATAIKDGVIDKCFTDYLLSEFQKTPFYWQRAKTIIRGVDSASRSIVVDVTYNTIETPKEVLADSFIVEGEPDFERKMKIRSTEWGRVLASMENGNADYPALLDKFTKLYGDPNEIVDSQRNLGLTEQVFETGNQRTYNGIIDNAVDKEGAEMTIRYVLVPNYVLGVNLGLTCRHMYVTDFEVLNDPTVDKELFKEDGYATITDNVTKLMNSYFKCIDENDHAGLYKLTKDYKALDKYYADMFDTTYSKHNNFSISLFNIEGTRITAGVKVSSKVRAKGSNMTMPSYTDRYYMEFELVDDTLKVTNMTLLSRKLEGEPTINTDDAGNEGFIASIDLSNTDKKHIEELICDFSSLQLLKDVTSDKFAEIVDFSTSEEKLASIKENMTSLGGTEKVVFLQTYQQGTSNYASVKCKEMFQSDDNSITEATVVYEFISKGDKWYIYDYNILSSVKLDTTNLTTSNSLCYVTPGKVEQYTSQIVSTESDTAKKGKDKNKKDKKDDAVIFEHETSAPILKNGTEEKGLVKMTASEITEEETNAILESAYSGEDNDEKIMTLAKAQHFDEAVGLSPEDGLENLVKSLCSARYNLDNNRYTDKELEDLDDTIEDTVEEFKEQYKANDVVKEDKSLSKILDSVGVLATYASEY